MACEESTKVEVLSKKESLSFFAEILGNYDHLSNELKNIAKLVAEECAGLPLAIKIVAASMRGVFDVLEWNNTLEELKNPIGIHKGIEDKVFCSLQVSYSRLNDVKLQNCILSCALYPGDYIFRRDDLVNLWILEGHVEEIPSWREKLNVVNTILNRLIGACLLDAIGSTGYYVKMPILIRDMVIQISRRSHQTMIRADMHLQEVPRQQEWTEELTKVSLVENNIRGIPLGMAPKCPNLLSLLLRENPLKTIPESFFQFLSSLKFLDLSYTRVESVPESVSYLENLSALKLTDCDFLTHVPSLEKLTKLRHLDLSDCYKISVLPQGMDKLVNLESLLVGGCDRLCIPFRELTAGLSNIRCLELSYGVEDPHATNIQELRCLERLMNCLMRDTSNFNTYVQSQNFHQLTSYQLHLALHENPSPYQCDYDRSIIIESKAFDGRAKHTELPQNIQELLVLGCTFYVSSLIDAFPLSNGLTSLIKLEISFCEGIEYVCSKPALENLEELEICWSSFKGLVWVEGKVTLPLGVFRNLRTLYMKECSNIEKLFTPCLLNGQLGNLEEITIMDCISLVEIFAGSELDEDANMELPKLRSLHLNRLPRLVSICKIGLQVCCKSIEDITILECPKLTNLPLFHQVLGNEVPSAPPPCLRRIEAEICLWDSLLWDDPCMKQTLQPFFCFTYLDLKKLINGSDSDNQC